MVSFVCHGGARLSLSLSRILSTFILLLLATQFAVALPISAQPAVTGSGPVPFQGFRPSGAAPQDQTILGTIALPLTNLGALDTFITQVSDPSSPAYRHFLTPQEAQEFLPTAAYASLLSRIGGTGLQVLMTALDSLVVVSGTVSQFEEAFGGTVDSYTNGTYSYYASSGAQAFDGAYVYASNATFLFERPALSSIETTGSNVTFTQGSFSASKLQTVYNATTLYADGDTGSGQTVGLLDFYGSPTIANDLGLFDRTFGFQDPHLEVIPLGPYDPNLGANVGWSSEISLDVEVSHAMAPGAAIDLYVANGALPLAAALAKIVQDDRVTTLSQSFGTPEWYYSLSSDLGGPSFFAMNALIPDQYYALGSAEGITFLSSSGDGGGNGFSSGPEGDLQYPSSSPFVTSVGGTQTYFSQTPSGGISFRQTAWSNIGYVPNEVNQGGGEGGVSILEPKPWYQSQQATPPSFPGGRENPDLALQAGVDPGTLIVDSGKVVGIGGTSEASPLLAGLLTLTAQSLKGSLGLINPVIYKIGNDQAEYSKAFSPITFGYTIPWRASPGYNLATGWGAPNIGELTGFFKSSSNGLEIRGEISNSSGKGQVEYTLGQNLTLNAKVSQGGMVVTTGTFTMNIQTLGGTFSPTKMAFDPASGNWTGGITLGTESGLAYVNMFGMSGSGDSGQAMGVIFAGYLGSIEVPGSPYVISTDPWSWNSSAPLKLTIAATDLEGRPAPPGNLTLSVEAYSFTSNEYKNSSSATFMGTGSGTYVGSLTKPVPSGPMTLIAGGDLYSYAPAVFGIYLQSSYIYPEVAAEPGSAAPGQYLTIIANPIPPVNVYFETSLETGRLFAQDVLVGSNVSATLVSPSGEAVSIADLHYQPCAQALRVCNGGSDAIYGQLSVPEGSQPGLYTVQLHASYMSFTAGGNLTGNFYGQVWVSGPEITPSISISSGYVHVSPDYAIGQTSGQDGELFQGEPAHIVASIAYSNGTQAKFGEYSAIVYPASLAGQYTTLMHDEYAAGQLVQLEYDPGIGKWVGNVTLPSSADQGSLAGLAINSFDYSGPYDAFVTGLAWDGTPTTSALGAQQPFFVSDYQYYSGSGPWPSTGSQIAFDNSAVPTGVPLSGDYFIGTNTIAGGNVVITDSIFRGNLTIMDSNVTLVGVNGGDFNASGSGLTFKDSSVGSVTLVHSNITLVDSSFGSINPSLPTVSVSGLTEPIGGLANYTVTISGADLASPYLSAWIDGSKISLTSPVITGNPGVPAHVAVDGSIDASTLNDGVHTLTVTVSQSDGLSSTLVSSFSTNAHVASVASQATELFYLVYILLLVSLIGLVAGVLAAKRGH